MARSLEDTIDAASEESIRCHGDLVLLIVRGALAPDDLCPVVGRPTVRTIRADVATGNMSRRRALIYGALYDDAREWLPEAQDEAASAKIGNGMTAEQALRPWLLAIDKDGLHGFQNQNARSALAVYLFKMRATMREWLGGIDVDLAAAAANESRAVRPARFAEDRKRQASERLAAALEVYAGTHDTVRQLLKTHEAPPKHRRRTPLTSGEATLAFSVYRTRLDAPLPSTSNSWPPIGRRKPRD